MCVPMAYEWFKIYMEVIIDWTEADTGEPMKWREYENNAEQLNDFKMFNNNVVAFLTKTIF